MGQHSVVCVSRAEAANLRHWVGQGPNQTVTDFNNH